MMMIKVSLFIPIFEYLYPGIFMLPLESIIVFYLISIYIDCINEPKQKQHRCLFGQLSAPQQLDCCKHEEDIDNCSIRSKKLHVQSSEDKSTHRSKHI